LVAEEILKTFRKKKFLFYSKMLSTVLWLWVEKHLDDRQLGNSSVGPKGQEHGNIGGSIGLLYVGPKQCVGQNIVFAKHNAVQNIVLVGHGFGQTFCQPNIVLIKLFVGQIGESFSYPNQYLATLVSAKQIVSQTLYRQNIFLALLCISQTLC